MDGFKLGGRLNRSSFLTFFVIFVAIWVMYVIFWDTYLAHYVIRNVTAHSSKEHHYFWEIIKGVLFTVNTYMLYSLCMRRIRDVGKGVMIVDIFFPLYFIGMLIIRVAGNPIADGAIIILGFLLAIPGSDGYMNKYGESDQGRNPLQYVVYAGLYLIILTIICSVWLIMR